MKNDRKCAHTRFFAFLEHFFKTEEERICRMSLAWLCCASSFWFEKKGREIWQEEKLEAG